MRLPNSRAGRYAGWTMAFVAFVSVALTFGSAGATMPLIYGAIVADLGWSLTEATLIYAYKNTAAAVATLAVAGPLIARFGPRRIMATAFVITGTGMLGLLIVHTMPVYYLAGAVQGIGLALAMVAANVLISRWFTRNRGMALGLALTGVSAGGAVFPLIAAPLIEAIGWRATMASLSLAIWLIAMPLLLWLARDEPTPAELELEPGRQSAAVTGNVASTREVPMDRPSWQVIVAALALLTIAVADIAIVQHTPLILASEAGISANLAALALSLIAIFSIVGKIVAGRCYDRFAIGGMRCWYLFVGASIVLILGVTGTLTLVLFAAVRGFAHGGLFPMPAMLARHSFGSRLTDTRLSVFLGIWMIGAGLGPALLSMLYETSGHYRHGLALFALLSLIAALLLWCLRSQPVPAATARRAEAVSR